MNTRNVKSIYKAGSSHWVGDGFPVQNFFPSTGVDSAINPFLMLDYAGPKHFEASSNSLRRGVGEHPHRGFETVTIAYKGSVEHKDSAGNAGTIHPGDVQWMTAGSGVVHEERHEREYAARGGDFEMIQLWVNLPKKDKMTDPRYQTLLDKNIPHVQLDEKGSFARVIAGSLNNTQGPASTFTPVTLLDVRLSAKTKVELPIANSFNAALLFMRGSLKIGSATISDEPKLVLLDTKGDTVSIEANEESVLLLMAGEPINEPVASYGPFVMNTREEIMQAVTDYQAGRMGHLT